MKNFALHRDATSSSPAKSLDSVGFKIQAIDGQPHSYELVIKGFLAPGWTGRLTAALAKHRIGIVRGEAEKVTASAWHARFELKTAPFAKDPLSIDYIALAGTELPYDRNSGKIALLDVVMEPSSRHAGSLYIEVTGVDRLGFLGDLLDYFSMRCLFPIKMSVETVADTAVDRFWLRGVGASIPSESITAAIKENLERLLVGNA
ncbi:MAG: hypothetical protein A2075_03430 [Geobacteraceae bacterium GWC2_58_44]|nr:MAG: hypothetical protein A2075_03430 [Geobacteraceae bacterium GWC2_58_44]HBG04452.1 hypothetical protein [Geobacter sp.]